MVFNEGVKDMIMGFDKLSKGDDPFFSQSLVDLNTFKIIADLIVDVLLVEVS